LRSNSIDLGLASIFRYSKSNPGSIGQFEFIVE